MPRGRGQGVLAIYILEQILKISPANEAVNNSALGRPGASYARLTELSLKLFQFCLVVGSRVNEAFSLSVMALGYYHDSGVFRPLHSFRFSRNLVYCTVTPDCVQFGGAMRGRKTKLEVTRTPVGYTRVSTREQSADGHSLGAQESRLKALAQAQGAPLGRIFVDPGYGAGTLKRPGVRDLLASIQRGEVSALYVAKLDRLCRNLSDLLAVVPSLERHDVALVSASEQIDTGSPAGRMMLSMLGAFAEFERARISERIADVAFDLRQRRQVYDVAPFGFVRVGNRLIPVEKEQTALREMRKMRLRGASYRDIAAWMTAEQISPKGRSWYASSVRAILESKMTLDTVSAEGDESTSAP